jgi:hypothetical protein
VIKGKIIKAEKPATPLFIQLEIDLPWITELVARQVVKEDLPLGQGP